MLRGVRSCLWVSQAVSHQITNICSPFVVTKTVKPAWILAICENFGVADKPDTVALSRAIYTRVEDNEELTMCDPLSRVGLP
jgi:hypothetical protein